MIRFVTFVLLIFNLPEVIIWFILIILFYCLLSLWFDSKEFDF